MVAGASEFRTLVEVNASSYDNFVRHMMTIAKGLGKMSLLIEDLDKIEKRRLLVLVSSIMDLMEWYLS